MFAEGDGGRGVILVWALLGLGFRGGGGGGERKNYNIPQRRLAAQPWQLQYKSLGFCHIHTKQKSQGQARNPTAPP